LNTPRSKPLVRHSKPKKYKKPPPRTLDGAYVGALRNDELLIWLGRIVTHLPHLEDLMASLMAVLMGDLRAPARQIFRSLVSDDLRVKVMRSFLEHAKINDERGSEFDLVLDEFVAVKKFRNSYVHGLWRTHTATNRAFLSEPSPDSAAQFMSEREVTAAEMRQDFERMARLFRTITVAIYPDIEKAAAASSTS